MMESKIVSTMASDSFLGRSVARITSSTKSALVTVSCVLCSDKTNSRSPQYLGEHVPSFARPAAFAYHQFAVRGRTFARPSAPASTRSPETPLQAPLGHDGVAD